MKMGNNQRNSKIERQLQWQQVIIKQIQTFINQTNQHLYGTLRV